MLFSSVFLCTIFHYDKIKTPRIMFNFLIPLIFCINFSLSVPKRDYALYYTFLAYSFLRYCEYNMRTSLLIFKGTLVFLIISTMLYSRDLD